MKLGRESQNARTKYIPADRLTCGMCGETKDIKEMFPRLITNHDQGKEIYRIE
jgi:hypothetical protein